MRPQALTVVRFRGYDAQGLVHALGLWQLPLVHPRSQAFEALVPGQTWQDHLMARLS